EDLPGFCKSITNYEIKTADYVLTPGRYIDAAPSEVDQEPMNEKIMRLTAELNKAFVESKRIEDIVREQMGRMYE
ncbi:MAG: SAM-dependent DNA methyltransferase, partial [Blastocatellia bacterium]|nr:SAM-dependent DNA methyltransferase [Blastocatellia bacterium]